MGIACAGWPRYVGGIMKVTNRLVFALGAMLVCLASGCASAPKGPDAVAFTEQALRATEAASHGLARDPEAAKKAEEQFKVFNSDFSAQNITNRTKEVYAADVYFRDPFKEIHGEPEFEAYLLRGSSAVAEFSMDWKDVSENDGNYYFRWIMNVKLKRDSAKDPPTRVTGISQVRFGPDGKVIFHQDYFDGADLIYEKVPVMGGVIRYIKKHI